MGAGKNAWIKAYFGHRIDQCIVLLNEILQRCLRSLSRLVLLHLYVNECAVDTSEWHQCLCAWVAILETAERKDI